MCLAPAFLARLRVETFHGPPPFGSGLGHFVQLRCSQKPTGLHIDLSVPLHLLSDRLSGVVSFVVALVVLAIQVFTVWYLREDKRYAAIDYVGCAALTLF